MIARVRISNYVFLGAKTKRERVNYYQSTNNDFANNLPAKEDLSSPHKKARFSKDEDDLRRKEEQEKVDALGAIRSMPDPNLKDFCLSASTDPRKIKEIFVDAVCTPELFRTIKNRQTKRQYYKILGMEPGSSATECKKRFQMLRRICHPDKNRHPLATEVFQKVQASYDALK